MATALDIIKGAMRCCNVLAISETPTGDESAAALTTLNDMLASWANHKLMTYQMVQRSKALTSGTAAYTIGSGGSIDTTRPLRINAAFVRDSNSSDFPISVISNDEYARISSKSLTGSYPGYLYYRANYPLGQINLYPAPGSGMTLYLEVWDQLTQFTALTDTVSLPPGYERLLKYGLAIELAAEYHPPEQLMQSVRASFMDAKESLQDVNNVEVPILRCDSVSGGSFNITSGEYE